MTPLLKVEGLRKSFAGMVALRDAPFNSKQAPFMPRQACGSSALRIVVNASLEAKPAREGDSAR